MGYKIADAKDLQQVAFSVEGITTFINWRKEDINWFQDNMQVLSFHQQWEYDFDIDASQSALLTVTSLGG